MSPCFWWRFAFAFTFASGRSIDNLNNKEDGTITIQRNSYTRSTDGTGVTSAPDKQEWRSLRKDQDRAQAYEENTHFTHLPLSHSAAAGSDQMPVLPEIDSKKALETNGISTPRPLNLAPVATLSSVSSIETCQSVLSIAGLHGMTAWPSGPSSPNSTSSATCDNSQAAWGHSSPAAPAAANSSGLECYSTGALASRPQFRMAEMSAQMTDPTTRQTFVEQVAYWGHRRDVTLTVAGGDTEGEGKALAEQTAFGLKFYWPHEHSRENTVISPELPSP